MHGRRLVYLCGGIAAIVVAVAAAVVWRACCRPRSLSVDAVLAGYDPANPPGGVNVRYPFDGAVFPPEIAPPTFRWEDSRGESDAWVVRVQFADSDEAVVAESPGQEWTPSESQWQTMRRRSLDSRAEATVLGVRRSRPDTVLSSGRVSFSTSTDEVGAPIFFREVNLPFRDAVNDPSTIRWRFGDVASREPPPVVLENLPVCGNCHSFSADGKTLGMDVDYANDKGSYAIVSVEERMLIEPSKIITWSDYRREDGQTTLGLLSQVSPDGRHVASTVHDGSVFLPRPDLAFSQLFFPIKGIVGIYSRADKTFRSLPGADDPQYVQSNPVWSPDGKWIVFARSKRYRTEGTGVPSPAECRVFTHEGKTFLFDLYRVPFNNGAGGRAEPLRGASHNGMSNYFARFSPDGKWIVFCRARSFMLLQPDSELYVLPSEGGQPRRLRCNTSRMNSWHSFSPNGRWMVFSSKAFSPYTQLFLTHFDATGEASPPVLLDRFTASGRAANIPEFVRAAPGAIRQITEQFLNDYSFVRQAHTNVQFDDLDQAEASCRKALAMNPKNADALCDLGTVLAARGRAAEAIAQYRAALRLAPEHFQAHFALGMQLIAAGRTDEAIEHFKAAVQIRPAYPPPRYQLGLTLQRQGQFEQALVQYERVMELDPNSAPALAQAAFIRATSPQRALRNLEAALQMAQKACELTKYEDPEFLATLARVYAETGRHAEATATSRRAVAVARRLGREDFARRVERDFQDYWRRHAGPDKAK